MKENISSLEQLDAALIEMKKALHCCYVFAEYDWEIGQDPESHGFPQFFGFAQMACQRALHVGLYSLYTTTKYNTTCSVPDILRALKGFELKNRKAFDKAIQSDFGIKISPNLDDEAYKERAINKLSPLAPNIKNDEALNMVADGRNKKFAHLQAKTPEKITLPSVEETHRLIDWADKFINLIYDGFLDHSPADIKYPARKAIQQAQGLIKKCRKTQD